jgi:nicotinamide mononucleotide transporter
MTEFIHTHWIEMTGALLGLLYLYYEYKADIKIWATGILMSIFYVYVYLVNDFYAFAAINVYYIITQIYGWTKWTQKKEEEKPLCYMPLKYIAPLSGITALLFILLAILLFQTGESTVAWGDSFITSLSIVAIWMLSRKYIEQWIPLIVANLASIFIFYHQELYPTSLMYAVYFVVSIFGYINWKRIIKKEKNEEL